MVSATVITTESAYNKESSQPFISAIKRLARKLLAASIEKMKSLN